MPDVTEKMKAVFGKGKPLAPVAPPPPKPPEVKLPPKPKKGIEDISIAIAAQRIYNPAMPPAPPTKAPTTAMLEQGSAPAMDQSGPWGKPEKK
jgi:hypothetical protein